MASTNNSVQNTRSRTMKKIIFILALAIFLISTAKAEQLSQSEVDAVNFATLNLDYQGGEIQLAEISQEYVLTTVVTYYGLEPAGDRMYDLTRKQIRLNYNEPEFFECWSAGSSTDVDCFNQYVLPQ